MPLELNKVVELFEKCGIILKTKADLFLCFSIFAELPTLNRSLETDNTSLLMSKYVNKFLTFWIEEILVYENYHPAHLEAANVMFGKANSFKNKTQLLSKEEQISVEITQMIDQFKNSVDSVAYYTMKKRISIKETLTQKLKQLKSCLDKTSETRRPMYPHKFEKQLKESFFHVYSKQVETDVQTFQKTYAIYQRISYQCKKIRNHIKQSSRPLILPTYKSQFLEENYEIIVMKKQTPGQNLTKYTFNINKIVKKFYNFWVSIKESFDILISGIKSYIQVLRKVKENSHSISQQFYASLNDLPNEIWKLFRVNKIFNLIKILDENLLLIEVLTKLAEKLRKQKSFLHKLIEENRQYLIKISKNLQQREKNFTFYISQDRKFLEDQCKAEKNFDQFLFQTFNDFFHDCFNILKQANQLIDQEKIKFYEFHEVSGIVGKIIIQNENESSNIKDSRSSLQNSKYVANSEKNSKIASYEKFIDSIEIFDGSEVQSTEEQFTSALGPKLLLHGKTYIMSKGLYFESVFNKKNLFFGKTRLYIPKQDILQINQTNALVIFPDVIEIMTPHGPINLHALGSRQKMFDSLNSYYFPENVREEGEQSQADFNQCQIQANIEDHSEKFKPYEGMNLLKVFRGCKLNKFFRRYLSDDEFQLKGRKYETFKHYFYEHIIEGKDIKSTPITPQPPSYFLYKNEKKEDEETAPVSERIHTYGKHIPVIPFVSKGGQALCEDRQVYTWFSPKLLLLEIFSVLKGFSLAQGMTVKTKIIYQEISEGVRQTTSVQVIFQTPSAVNNLIKSPTISNMKSAMAKADEVIEKYEKGKGGKKVKGAKLNTGEVQDLRERILELETENEKLIKKLKYGAILFGLIYFISMVLVFHI